MQVLIPCWTAFGDEAFYQDFVGSIEEALRALGHRSERFEFQEIGALDQQELDRFQRWSSGAQCDLVIDLCCWGWGLSRLRHWDGGTTVGETVFDSLGARYVALLLDHPYFQPLPAIESAQLTVACPDRDHRDLIKLIYPSARIRAALFLPPATRPENDRSPVRWRDKSMDILYAGNLAPDALHPSGNRPGEENLAGAVSEFAMAHPDLPLLRCALEVLRGAKSEIPAQEMTEIFRSVEYFLRNYLRHRLIAAVAKSGASIDVYGKGWEGLGLPPSVRIHAPTDYPTLMKLIGAARICLDASTYLGGVNDRIFHFAINRSAFFSNSRAYVEEAFGSESGAFCYSMDKVDELGERILAALARPAELEARAEQSRRIAFARHLWVHRVAAILDAIR